MKNENEKMSDSFLEFGVKWTLITLIRKSFFIHAVVTRFHVTLLKLFFLPVRIYLNVTVQVVGYQEMGEVDMVHMFQDTLNLNQHNEYFSFLVHKATQQISNNHSMVMEDADHTLVVELAEVQLIFVL